MRKGMRKDRIVELCNASGPIRECVAAFRRIHPLRRIDDLWEMAHFVSNVEEAYLESEGTLYHWKDGRIVREGERR